ncbi:MAG: zinc ribbon domain-containing protein [Pseudomonadales bacterium]|nr:zinc ribbon domain-containing protein [Pseudomonadales bacterium]
MPIYEYVCEGCGHEFETIQKFSDAPLTECPACHAGRLVKKISAAGFRLKGGGWYETDFKNGAKRNVAADAASGSAAGTDGGAGADGASSTSNSTKKGSEKGSESAAPPTPKAPAVE